MKKLMTIMLALGAFGQLALADHARLTALSAELTIETTELVQRARRVVGIYPSYRQRYALEHIRFFRNSALQFERAVYQSESINDHAAMERAYQRLLNDAFHARQTFRNLYRFNSGGCNTPVCDLSGSNAHPSDTLESIMDRAEDLTQEIGRYID